MRPSYRRILSSIDPVARAAFGSAKRPQRSRRVRPDVIKGVVSKKLILRPPWEIDFDVSGIFVLSVLRVQKIIVHNARPVRQRVKIHDILRSEERRVGKECLSSVS